MACAFCTTEHHPLDGCPKSATKFQCSRCKDTGILNPGWAVNSFIDEPCHCEKYRCHGCFSMLETGEDPCQKCGELVMTPGFNYDTETPDEIGIEGVLKSFNKEAA